MKYKRDREEGNVRTFKEQRKANREVHRIIILAGQETTKTDPI